MRRSKIFKCNFTMVVFGQIISLFGNAVINMVNTLAGLLGPIGFTERS